MLPLSPWCLELLDALGLGAMIRPKALTIRAGIIGGIKGEPVELRSNYEAAVLLRAHFDTLLAHAAALRGAELREGVQAQELVRDDHGRLIGLKASEGDLETEAAIVCNGAKTKLAQNDRPVQTLHTIMGRYEGVENVSDAVEIYFDAVVKPHYGWVFPESAKLVNIGICYIPTKGGPNARERFQAFIDHRLAKRIKYATQIGKQVGHPILTTHRPTALSQQGVLVAGEAGGLVDPATAEGIHHALASGNVAGQFMGSVLQGNDLSAEKLALYTKLIRKQIGQRLMVGQLFLHYARTPMLDLTLHFGSFKSVQAVLTWMLTKS